MLPKRQDRGFINNFKIANVFKDAKLLYPGEFKLGDYEVARNLIVERYCEIEGLVAIYEFGKINNPGISDLDLIFVFEDDINKTNLGTEFLRKVLPVFVQNILCGSTLMVISQTNFSNILIWDDLVLNRIYGKDISFKHFNDEKGLRDVVQIMDWLPERILSIKKHLHLKSIPIVRFLGLLHSLNYTFEKIISGGYVSQHIAEKYIKHIESTSMARRAFLGYDDIESREVLASLTETSFMLGYQAMGMLIITLNEKQYYTSDRNSSMGKFLLTMDSGYKFFAKTEYQGASIVSEDLVEKIVYVPSEWGLHWKTYGEIKGPISEKIKKALTHGENINGKVDPKIRDFLHRRIIHCNSMAEFLTRNGFAKGLYKFGWFF
jgi:hypothetical protein